MQNNQQKETGQNSIERAISEVGDCITLALDSIEVFDQSEICLREAVQYMKDAQAILCGQKAAS